MAKVYAYLQVSGEVDTPSSSSYGWFHGCRAFRRYRIREMMDSEASDRTGDELAMTYGPSGPTRGSKVVVQQNHGRFNVCIVAGTSFFTKGEEYGCSVTAIRKRPRRTRIFSPSSLWTSGLNKTTHLLPVICQVLLGGSWDSSFFVALAHCTIKQVLLACDEKVISPSFGKSGRVLYTPG